MLRQLSDWKSFERLCADLLEAEGFEIESEPSVDTTGTDFRAKETYRSHDPGRSISVRWRVQCKHYAPGGGNLGRKEIEEAIYAYETRRRPDDGLFLMVSSDYSEAGKAAIDTYTENHKDARVLMWNGRQIATRLERHGSLLHRYGLSSDRDQGLDPFVRLARFKPARVLFISDQSAMAHDLAEALRRQGLEVVYLPVWNYMLPNRLELFVRAYSADRFHMAVLFFGDTFGVPLPKPLQDWVRRLVDQSVGVLYFPFLAWMSSGTRSHALQSICPVKLPDEFTMGGGHRAFDSRDYARQLGEYRKGDYGRLLSSDAFAEDRYVEYEPTVLESQFGIGIEKRFGLSHTFEYLEPRVGAKVQIADPTGNPLLVTDEKDGARFAYVNSCCHACFSTMAVSSPMRVSLEFRHLLANACDWLMASATVAEVQAGA